jgi:hypothetical protein
MLKGFTARVPPESYHKVPFAAASFNPLELCTLTPTMPPATEFPFTDLPFELQREIFLVAAEADRRQSVRLALVAHRFRIW